MMITDMLPKDREAVTQMMEVFYASDAVLSNGSAEIFRNDIDACVGDNPFLHGYVFREGEELLGYAMVAKSFSTEFGKPCVWLEDLYIRPAYRGQGIGKAFFETLFAAYPHAVIRLEAEEENQNAIALYKKCGFEVLGYLELIRK